MKKILFISINLFVCFSTQAQTNSTPKKSVDSISTNVNDLFDTMIKSLEQVNWKDVNTALQQSATAIEKHADIIINEIQKMDTKKLEQSTEKLAQKIESSIDVEKLEDSMNKIAEKLDKAIAPETTTK
jgi:ABC-type transporter Mla subunit MlaD